MLSALQTGRSGRTCSDGLADGRHSRLIKRDWPDPRPSTAGRSGRRAADGEQGILHTTAADKEKADKKQKTPKACRFFRHTSGFFCEVISVFYFLFTIFHFSGYRKDDVPSSVIYRQHPALLLSGDTLSADGLFSSVIFLSSSPDDPDDCSCSHSCEVTGKIQCNIAQLRGTS